MNYKEQDIGFYGEEELHSLEIEQNEYGFKLSWNLDNTGEGYAIYRKPIQSKSWELLTTLSRNTTSFQDSKPPSNNMYEYKIYSIIEGDFMVQLNEDIDADFLVTEETTSAEQDILNRVRTQKGDWRSHENLGADLELLEGERNTKETGIQGEEQI